MGVTSPYPHSQLWSLSNTGNYGSAYLLQKQLISTGVSPPLLCVSYILGFVFVLKSTTKHTQKWSHHTHQS